MEADSYTLREVAEILGVSKRTLQRRMREGAFPGRFLSPGRHGLETRIPAEDLSEVLQDLHRQGRATWRRDRPEKGADAPSSPSAKKALRVRERVAEVAPAEPEDSLVPYQAAMASKSESRGVSTTDLESVRDVALAIVREERAAFLEVVRDNTERQAHEMTELRDELLSLHESVRAVRIGLKNIEHRVTEVISPATDNWNEPTPIVSSGDARLEGVLEEIGQLEALLAARFKD